MNRTDATDDARELSASLATSGRSGNSPVGWRRPTIRAMAHTLVLLRHGESTWNQENLFTGWHDVDLTDKGAGEAAEAGRTMADGGPVVRRRPHLAADAGHPTPPTWPSPSSANRWLPVAAVVAAERAPLRRPPGQEQEGRRPSSTAPSRPSCGARSYDVPPPAVSTRQPRAPGATIPATAGWRPTCCPASECLKDVVARVLPYWYDAIVPDLRAGRTVLVVAHGNCLRALVKHLDGISDDDIAELNIPTGVPRRYELDDSTARGDGRVPGRSGRHRGGRRRRRRPVASRLTPSRQQSATARG